MRVGMVAGETSGDLLAARVLQGLRTQHQDLLCEGIGGPAMVEQGFTAWHPIDRLSVFGYVDALKRLPGLIRTYRHVKQRWQTTPPDVFVGVDAPDFNLRLEASLRQAGVPTIQFVSPSIWAWRYERIHQIRAAVSHMLVLFPFEETLYRKEGIPVTYVGHPLAWEIPEVPDKNAARSRLGLPAEARVLAVLPGSRRSEIHLLADRFIQAARALQQQDPALHIVIPTVNAQRHAELEAMLERANLRHYKLLVPETREHDRPVAWDAMEASDAVLAASGTATLEAALFKRPMVISYVLSPTMRRIMAWKSGQKKPLVPWVGLPNILAREFIVPELLQEAATPGALAEAAWKALTDTTYRQQLHEHYQQLHSALKRDTGKLAAQAIMNQIQ